MNDTPFMVIGCWPYEQGKSGLALPIFVHPENASILLIQEVDQITGKISGFRNLAAFDLPLLAIQATVGTAIGSDPIYAILADDGKAYAGTAAQLKTRMKNFVSDNPHRNATNLQIAELIGNEDEKKIARVRMRHEVAKHAGANAAESFYTGALRSVLWGALIKRAPNEEIANRILRVRSRVDAFIRNGELIFDLEAIEPEYRTTINIEDLKAQVTSEFELSPADPTTPEKSTNDVRSDADASQKKVIEILRQINRAGRQEERIAILMDSIIADRSIGLSALLQYGTDRAKFATSALSQLRNLFFQGPSEKNLRDAAFYESALQNELFPPQLSQKGRDALLQETNLAQDPSLLISVLIPRLFSQQYPMSRGELLYFLSKHLAKWPRVNRAIQQSLNQTASVYVDDWRSLIQQNLSNPSN